jgi:hypothetical protein
VSKELFEHVLLFGFPKDGLLLEVPKGCTKVMLRKNDKSVPELLRGKMFLRSSKVDPDLGFPMFWLQ